jgi:hypothetical protein
VIAMLTVAGATITAKVTVQDKFFDPANDVELLDLAEQASQPTVPARAAAQQRRRRDLQRAAGLGCCSSAPAGRAGDLTAVLTAYTSRATSRVDEGPAAAPRPP